MRRSVAWAAAVAMTAFGLAVEIGVGDSQPLRVAAGDLLAGLALGWAGAAAIVRAPRTATGPWLLAGAVLWFMATLAASAVPAFHDAGPKSSSPTGPRWSPRSCRPHAGAARPLSSSCSPGSMASSSPSAARPGHHLLSPHSSWPWRWPRRSVARVRVRFAPVLCLVGALAIPAAVREFGESQTSGIGSCSQQTY